MSPTFFEPGPHLRAIMEVAPFPIPFPLTELPSDPATWKARCDEYRQSRGLWLPGDFLHFGAPPTLASDDSEPYQALAVNCETGTLLTDWAWLTGIPGVTHPLRDWRLRRIADLCRVIRVYRTMLRDRPDDPATGRLPTDARQPIGATWSWMEKSNGDRWALMHRRTDTTTKPEALTAYGALRILAGALTERLDAIHTGGPTPGLPLSRLLAACGSDPAYWPDSADADLDAATGELLQLQAAGRAVAPPAASDSTKASEPLIDPAILARLEAAARTIPAVLEAVTRDADERPKTNVPKLKAHDRQAWQLATLNGWTQTKVAEILNREHGTNYTQGQVSRMIARAKSHAEASGLAAHLAKPIGKTYSVDPRRLELGARVDKRKPRPSESERSEADD